MGETSMIADLRKKRPLVQVIGNAVSANDCANLLLACGASPIMADDPHEAEEIASSCDALVLNLGMLSQRKLDAMRLAGRCAVSLGKPIVLDPVGVGASAFRRDAVTQLLREIRVTAVRCNRSEAVTLCGGAAGSGVDDCGEPVDASALAHLIARTLGTTVCITGETDVISDGTRLSLVRNGHPRLTRITATGCMLSALVGAFCAVLPSDPFFAARYAAAAMGLCGEYAAAHSVGTGTMRVALIDAMSTLNDDMLTGGMRIEDQ